MRDILGVLREWGPAQLTVEREDGRVEVVQHADVVTGKPVPPRASVRQRVPAADLERICARGWQPSDTRALGEWLLRAAGGFTGRANSALVSGDPGRPIDDALREVEAFYAERALLPQAQVVVDSPEDAALVDRGWVRARPGAVDAIVQVASVAIARRRRTIDPGNGAVELDEAPGDEWIRRYGRSIEADSATVRAVLTSGDATAFARVGDPIVGIGRAVMTDEWVGLSAVEVDADHRRAGIGTAVVAALLEWAASLGARSAYVQTVPGNHAAISLYEPFGFVTHHEYKYLRPPD
ncbi:MAG TPA: GNAT family N-acetyltransferase [Nocardioidaceae bacterium]|nr:GNAT family N-acetyltransferase [Nocardioidaceae bacterium]